MSSDAVPGRIEYQSLPTRARVPRLLMQTGLACLVIAGLSGLLGEGNQRQFWFAYLQNWIFFLTISIGALFFVALQHVTRSGWSVTVRRIGEIIGTGVTPLAILFAPVLLQVLAGSGHLFEWNSTKAVAADKLIAAKSPYLNSWFFALRAVLYFGLWSWLAWSFLKRSGRMDRAVSPDSGQSVFDTQRLAALSAPGLVLLFVTISFASIDWIMSLDPHWFSTIFGIYLFAGSAVSVIAMLVLCAAGLQRSGFLRGVVTTEHYHDLGKLLFGFLCFWGYIAFSQYLLIWYANIPEETTWYQIRQSGPWGVVSIALIAGHFVLPFIGLMPRKAKRSKPVLVFWASFVLLMHWVDLYWLITPQRSANSLPFGFVDALCLLGIGGFYLGWLYRTAQQYSLLAVGDPRLRESLRFVNH